MTVPPTTPPPTPGECCPRFPSAWASGINILSMVWTGNEAVVSGGLVTAAYNPVTDSWRRLADRAVSRIPHLDGRLDPLD